MIDLAEIASYVSLAVLVVIAACWLWSKLFEYFSPEAKSERVRINVQIAEQHRTYDEYLARRDMEEALAAANSEVDVWRNKGGM